MTTYESITLMLGSSMFVLSLISLIVMLIKDNDKGKK